MAKSKLKMIIKFNKFQEFYLIQKKLKYCSIFTKTITNGNYEQFRRTKNQLKLI